MSTCCTPKGGDYTLLQTPTDTGTSSSCTIEIFDSQASGKPTKKVYKLPHSMHINAKSFYTYVLRVSGGLVGSEGAPSTSRPSSSPMPPMSEASSPKSDSESIRADLMSL